MAAIANLEACHESYRWYGWREYRRLGWGIAVYFFFFRNCGQLNIFYRYKPDDKAAQGNCSGTLDL